MLLMGRRAMEMKWKSLVGGGDRGPESKAKRRSLKMARQPRKKAEGAPRWIEWRFKGRMMWRYKIGRREMNLTMFFVGILAAM